MKQYSITTANITPKSDDDCYLAPEDPIQELIAAAAMNGLGANEQLAEYRAKQRQPVIGSNKGQLQREQGIRPGTDEWFQLWFGKNK